MKPLVVSILSDLHFDSHLPSFGVTEERVKNISKRQRPILGYMGTLTQIMSLIYMEFV